MRGKSIFKNLIVLYIIIRRYFELHGVDIKVLCENVSHVLSNSTCSWRGFEKAVNLTVDDWFGGCGCHMANNQKGP